jgi:hypothetical protein
MSQRIEDEIWSAVVEQWQADAEQRQRFRRPANVERPTDRKRQYVVLRLPSLEELEAEVEQLLALGFVVVGGVQVETRLMSSSGGLRDSYEPETWYLQAMYCR